MPSRRTVLKTFGSGALVLGSSSLITGFTGSRASFAAAKPPLDPALPDGVKQEAILDALPGKAPLIKLTYRPPNYETPVNYFDSLYTPNNAFFVRYHLADIPEVDPVAWRLRVGGAAAGKPYELTLDQLKNEFTPVEIAAVCQCSGNRRGLFQPHVPGVEWGPGAMGNAKWKGARLKDVLDRAGIGKSAVEVVMDGADGPVLDKTPDFVKSIPAWKAMEENSLIAYEMNGQPLPHFNGFPARIVIPGWTATYWIKHVTSIEAIDKPFDGFWVKSAYRIPAGRFPLVQRFISQETEANTPITEMVVNSLITNMTDGARVAAKKPVEVRGIAWDGGYGIQTVEVSSDSGKTWTPATLSDDAGRFSFRQWRYRFTPAKPGRYSVMAKATNKLGQTQTSDLIQNPAGYHHNVMHRVTLNAV